MTQVRKITPLLTAVHRYDKTVSTLNRGRGQLIDAPILAYLIETTQGRVLYDLGCDRAKITDPALRRRHYNTASLPVDAPQMDEEHSLPRHLARLGLAPADVDIIFVGHLHFDHVGGLKELCRCGCGAEIHVQADEMAAARSGEDVAVFADDLVDDSGRELPFKLFQGEYQVLPGVRAIASPGHTAGHMSLWIETPQGAPVILAGDAADLQENIDDEVAPGGLWRNSEALAIASIRKLKALAAQTGAVVWPNHDMVFYRQLLAQGLA